jgi:cytochrome c oxidase subunit 1
MPRRYYNYPPQFQALHIVSTAGSWVLATGLSITAMYLVHALFRGKLAGDNPWGSRCFEWRTTSPPPTHNFHATPAFELGAYDYTQPLPGAEDASAETEAA